jgi:hypothetical protein
MKNWIFWRLTLLRDRDFPRGTVWVLSLIDWMRYNWFWTYDEMEDKPND